MRKKHELPWLRFPICSVIRTLYCSRAGGDWNIAERTRDDHDLHKFFTRFCVPILRAKLQNISNWIKLMLVIVDIC